eukprot:919749-Alexandrium_andersonii.AAC.1
MRCMPLIATACACEGSHHWPRPPHFTEIIHFSERASSQRSFCHCWNGLVVVAPLRLARGSLTRVAQAMRVPAAI